MRSEKHLRFGTNFLPRSSDIQERGKKKERKTAEHGICLRYEILHVKKENEMVMYSFYFHIKRSIKPLGMQKKKSEVL